VIHVGYHTIARDERENVIESSRQLSEAADAEPENHALVLARQGPKRQKSGFDRANLVIRSTVVPAVGVLGGLAVLLVNLYCPAVNGLELSLFGADLMTRRFPSPWCQQKSRHHPDATNP